MEPMLICLWNFLQPKCLAFYMLFFLDLENVLFCFVFLLFQGCSWSVIFVDLDAHNRNRQTLCSLLPRESRSHVRYFYNKRIWTTIYYCFLKKVLKMLEVARKDEEREMLPFSPLSCGGFIQEVGKAVGKPTLSLALLRNYRKLELFFEAGCRE